MVVGSGPAPVAAKMCHACLASKSDTVLVRRGAVFATVKRDKWRPRDATPSTPLGIRVRTTAVRRLGFDEVGHGDDSSMPCARSPTSTSTRSPQSTVTSGTAAIETISGANSPMKPP